MVSYSHAHLVQHVGQLLQSLQLGLVKAQVGVFIPVADIQKGVAQLGHAVGNYAVANVQVEAVGIAGVTVGIQ